MRQIMTGLVIADCEIISKKLNQLLASNYFLYLKTHNFHWNVIGPMFQTLHTLFEGQYIDLWNAGDQIAERIRALGHFVEASYTSFSRLTHIQDMHQEDEQVTNPPTAEQMIRQLKQDHEAMAYFIRGEPLLISDSANDQVTLSLLTDRMAFHEKQAWMLRSLLNQ